MSDHERSQIFREPADMLRMVLKAREAYLDNLYWELRGRGVHPRQAEFILEDASASFLAGFLSDFRYGNTQSDDDRDRLNRFINQLRTL